MHFQGRKLQKGDLLKLTSNGQMIAVYKCNILGNGRTEVVFYHTEDVTKSQRKQIYLDVLELMGLERVEAGEEKNSN